MYSPSQYSERSSVFLFLFLNHTWGKRIANFEIVFLQCARVYANHDANTAFESNYSRKAFFALEFEGLQILLVVE